MKKRVIGLAIFLVVSLVVCYGVNLTSKGYYNTETYGEYNSRVNKETGADAAETMKRQTKSEVVKQHIEQENTKEKQTDDSQEKIKRQRKKKAYLTFDDGPSDNTPKILAALKKYNAKATFFMIGEQIVPEKEALVKAMLKEGHIIGVHTFTHNRKKMYANKQACLSDIKKTYEKLEEVTGIKPKYYRFPYGSANCYISGYCNQVIKELKDMGLDYVDWNVSGEDSVGSPSKSSIRKNVYKFKNYIEPVILLHDGQGNKLTAELLPELLEKIKAAGYEFGTLDERSEVYQWPHDWQK